MTPSTWLITGSSRGFGRALTVAPLDAGDQVVATARTPAELDDLVERHGDRILAAALDVTDAAAAASAFEAALRRFGRVDVVVNNAGYANVAPVETAPEQDSRRQLETNFWGVYKRLEGRCADARGTGRRHDRAVLVGRWARTGHRRPGLLSGREVRCRRPDPGARRRDRAAGYPLPRGRARRIRDRLGGASTEIQGVPEEYRATVGEFASYVSNGCTSASDPERAGEILVRVVKRARLPGHLLLGAGAAQMAIGYSGRQIAEATAGREVSASADFGAPYPVELPAAR
jgi:NAD(P)-dependent dehydrogenase (short-subunit alcohol dehydrogenase family)